MPATQIIWATRTFTQVHGNLNMYTHKASSVTSPVDLSSISAQESAEYYHPVCINKNILNSAQPYNHWSRACVCLDTIII